MKPVISMLCMCLCVFNCVCAGAPSMKPTPPLNPYRTLLTKLRSGDYAHAGDEAAIKLVLNTALRLMPEIQRGPTLDIGSGFGGTADYLARHQFYNVQGVDIDAGAVAYAQQHYPLVGFSVGNLLHLSQMYAGGTFKFSYMFNVLYAVEDKHSALVEIAKVTVPGGLLAIFDYTAPGGIVAAPLYDFAGKQMFPVNLSEVNQMLDKAGWEVVEVQDLTQQFTMWYSDFLSKLDKQEPELLKTFDQEHIDKVRKTFVFIQTYLENKTLGGVVIFAKRKEAL